MSDSDEPTVTFGGFGGKGQQQPSASADSKKTADKTPENEGKDQGKVNQTGKSASAGAKVISDQSSLNASSKAGSVAMAKTEESKDGASQNTGKETVKPDTFDEEDMYGEGEVIKATD